MDVRYLNREIWPFQVIITIDNRFLVDKWCIDRIGKQSQDWYGYSDRGITTYAFKESCSLLVFKLQWENYGNEISNKKYTT